VAPSRWRTRSRPGVLDAGVDGVIISPVTSLNGYQPGGITAVAEKLKPLLFGIKPTGTWHISPAAGSLAATVVFI